LQAIAPDVALLASVDKGDYVRHKYVMRTTPYSLMPFYLLMPKHVPRPLPVMLALSGHGYGVADIVGLWEDGSERRTPSGYHNDFAVALCRAGFAVAAPEISCFGERQTDFSYLDSVNGQPTPGTCHHSAMLAMHLGLTVPGIRVHDGLLTLGGGRLRLLLRCYAAPWGESPDGTVPAALRVDLVPQHEADVRPASEFAAVLETPRVRTIEDSGQILTSLAFETLVGPGEVLLIVPEVPTAEWRGASSADSTNTETPSGEVPSAREGDTGPLALDKPAPPLPPERIEFGAGPKPPRPKTVGEWILTDASDISDATRRLVVVIDPILPAEFRLLTPMR
jgi:hypothetical protein